MVSYEILKRAPVTAISTAGVLFFSFGLFTNEPKAIGVSIFLFLWVLFSKDLTPIRTSLITSIIALPFNITYIIPSLQKDAFVNGIYVNYLAPTLSIIDLIVLITILCFLYQKVILPRIFPKKSRDLQSSFNINNSTQLFRSADLATRLLIILAAYLILHSIIFWTPIVTLQSLRWIGYLYVALLIVKEFKETVGRSRSRDLSLLILTLLLVQLAIGSLQVARGTAVGLGWLGESIVAAGNADSSSIALNGDLYLRAYGTFPHPNLFAGFAVLGIIFALSAILRKDVRSQALPILIVIVSVINVIISFSHSAYLLILLFAMILLIRGFHHHFRKNPGRRDRLNLINPALLGSIQSNLGDRSIDERLMLLGSSFDYLKENLLIGVGNGNFTRYFYQFAPVGSAGITLLQPVHNIFVLILVEHGSFFGVLLILLLALYLLIIGIRTNFSLTYIFSILTILIIGNVDHYLLTLPQGSFFFLILLIAPIIFIWSTEKISGRFTS